MLLFARNKEGLIDTLIRWMIQETFPKKDKNTQYSFPQGQQCTYFFLKKNHFGLNYMKGKQEINVVLVKEDLIFFHNVR